MTCGICEVGVWRYALTHEDIEVEKLARLQECSETPKDQDSSRTRTPAPTVRNES